MPLGRARKSATDGGRRRTGGRIRGGPRRRGGSWFQGVRTLVELPCSRAPFGNRVRGRPAPRPGGRYTEAADPGGAIRFAVAQATAGCPCSPPCITALTPATTCFQAFQESA